MTDALNLMDDDPAPSVTYLETVRSAPLCFVDIETDGVHPGRQVWEIGMIRREPDAFGDDECAFFVEINLAAADLHGLNVGRFYERHPFGQWLSRRRDGRPSTMWAPTDGDRYVAKWEAAERVAQMTHGAHLVGAVPSFDAETLALLLRQERIIPTWHHHLIDVGTLALGYWRGMAARAVDEARGRGESVSLTELGCVEPPWNTEELSSMLGVEPPSEAERHTALGDARWARHLYDRIMRQPRL